MIKDKCLSSITGYTLLIEDGCLVETIINIAVEYIKTQNIPLFLHIWVAPPSCAQVFLYLLELNL